MNKMKKLIAFLLALCTIAGTMTSLLMVSGGVTVHADDETEEGTEPEEETVTVMDAWYYFHQQYGNDEEKLHTMKPFIETGTETEGLVLYALEETGEVAIKNKATGQVMFSNPRDTYLYSTKTEEEKSDEDDTFMNLASQLYVTFQTIETGETTTLNSYNDAAMNNQIVVSAIKNGVCVEYIMGAGTNRRLIPMNIEKSRYEENILNLILEAEDVNAYKRMSKEGGIYMLKDPFDPNVSQAAIDNMKAQYPVIAKKNMAIYVCDEKISNYEKNLIEGWIRAYAPKYNFEELEYDHELTEYVGSNQILPVFKMALEYKLTSDGFTVRLPASSITFNEDYFRLLSVTVLPYMGAGSSEYDGYTLVPDGSGTIIRFEDTLGKNEYSFGSDLYGPDNSYHTFSASYTGKLEIWRYPVFGMVENFYRYYLDGTNKEYCAHTTSTKVELNRADADYSEYAATCSKPGYEKMHCEICGEYFKGAAIPASHPSDKLKKVTVLKRAATCSSVSVDVEVCEECGEFQYTYGTELGTAHKYGEADENGHKDCLLCGKHAATTTIKRGEDGKDTYTLDKESSKDPTCGTAGSYVYKYTPPAVKNEDGTDKKDAQGNVIREEYDPAQYPDIIIEVAPTGHTLTLTKVAPSCSTGHQEVTCTTCNTVVRLVGMDLVVNDVIDFNAVDKDGNKVKIEYLNKFGLIPYCKEIKTPTGEFDANGKEIIKSEFIPQDGRLVFTVNGEEKHIVLKGTHKYVLITDIMYDKETGELTETHRGVCTDCGHVNTTFKVDELPMKDGAPSVSTDYRPGVTFEAEASDKNASATAKEEGGETSYDNNEAVIKMIDEYHLVKVNETKVVSKNPKHRYTEIKKYTVHSDCLNQIAGVKVERCAGCGHIRITTSDYHEWDNNTTTVIYPATKYTVGMQRISCKACHIDKYEEIPMLLNVEAELLPVITLVGIENDLLTGVIVPTGLGEYAGREDELVYKSANTNIVKVEAGGKLTAVASGTTRVDVSLVDEDGNEVYKAYCNVTVKFNKDTTGVKKPVQPAGTYKQEDPRGFVGIITEGESLCTVTSLHGGKLHKYNSISLTVNPRPSDTYELTGALTATGGDAKFTVVSDRKYTGSYRIQYYMLSNQESSDFEASYAGMAKAYRKYLEVDTKQLSKLNTTNQLPLYLETLGSVTVPDTFMSIPITRDEALTSFKNLTTMTKELNEAGIKNIHYRLTGYVNGGMTPTMPYDISYQEVLGGNKGYKNFVKYATESGASVYTDYDFAYLHKNDWFDGYSDSDHAVKAIDSRYIVKKTYNPTYQSFTSTGLLAVSPSVYDYFYSHFRAQDKKLGSTGISVSTLGTDLNSDFDKNDPYNREDTKLFTQQVLEKMKADYNGNVMTDGGNSYALPYAKHILNMSLIGSERMATSASVPFFSMVLHGAISYAGKPTNMASSMDEEILRIIENGSAPYFVLAYQNQSALKENSLLSKYYAVSYSHWKQDIIDVYTEVNGVIGGLQNANYNSHDYINAERIPGMVEYENEKLETVEAIAEMYASLKAADLALKNAETLVEQYKAYFFDKDASGKTPVDIINALANKIATKQNTAEELTAFNEMAASFTTQVTALNRYEENVVIKKEALNVVKTDLKNMLADLADVFGVSAETVANMIEVEDLYKAEALFTAETYKGYGSFDKDGKYTPRAEDFIGEDGVYNETNYTMSDNSVVRCGWDKDGDGKNDVVILINYNTFDVCAYEDGKPVIIGAMSYEVLERK
ncbi:MAG: hypothetical protein E7599_00555 [Ruminococcaceae bacterium]|nr:hypothetical protein [Oscillospiraceae bacterium]